MCPPFAPRERSAPVSLRGAGHNCVPSIVASLQSRRRCLEVFTVICAPKQKPSQRERTPGKPIEVLPFGLGPKKTSYGVRRTLIEFEELLLRATLRTRFIAAEAHENHRIEPPPNERGIFWVSCFPALRREVSHSARSPEIRNPKWVPRSRQLP